MEAGEGGAGNRNLGQVYRCFLVRCRLEERAGLDREPRWRFTVEQAGPGATRRSFACLADLVSYLEAEVEACGKDVAGEKERRAPRTISIEAVRLSAPEVGMLRPGRTARRSKGGDCEHEEANAHKSTRA